MKKITIMGLNAYAPMPQMLRERAVAVREVNRQLGRSSVPCYEVDFTVSGGWGYTQEDACVFDFGDEYSDLPIEIRRTVMDDSSVRLQRLFFERRVYEEIIHSPLPGTPDLHCLKWQKIRQSLIHGEDGRVYDRIDYLVSGFLEEDLCFLKTDHEECLAKDDEEGIKRNLKMADERIVKYDSVCWFDISCYMNL